MLSNLLDAAVLMLVGMVVVFIFLGLLIAGIHLIRLIGEDLPKVPSSAPQSSNSGASPTTIQLAAITAAVNQYRKNHK